MKYKLIVVWYTGERNEYEFQTEEKAQEGERGFKMAFGNQITFTCIIRG